ncbi:unnamed protein product [Cylindrotheca closterium]|uniref:Uncharacterized protein n=1 Tax=Cylindrotheca closterium TaxID=2856 RepID=A0AAD2JMT3_9STRA|nr:unnamed protein product [Cylindrotheca closterium]
MLLFDHRIGGIIGRSSRSSSVVLIVTVWIIIIIIIGTIAATTTLTYDGLSGTKSKGVVAHSNATIDDDSRMVIDRTGTKSKTVVADFKPATDNNNNNNTDPLYSPESDMCLEAKLPWDDHNNNRDKVTKMECRLHPCQEEAAVKPISQTATKDNEDDRRFQQRGFAIRYPNNFALSKNHLSMRVAGEARSGSGCAMSREYGFLFVHNLKVGGTNTKTFLKEALCPSNVTKINDITDHNQTKSQRRKAHFHCSRGEWMLQIIGCKRGLQEAKAKSYLIWSFVRNPFARLYSGYAMAEGMFLKKNPNASSFPSFKDFALATNRKREHMSPTSISHYVPQSHFLADVNGCPLVNYVGRLESYEADLLRVIHFVEEKRRDRHHRTSPTAQMNNTISEAKLQQRSTTFLLDYYHKVMVGPSANGKIQVGKGTAYGKRRKERTNGGSTTNNGFHAAYNDNQVVQHVVEEYKSDFDLFGYQYSTNTAPGVG